MLPSTTILLIHDIPYTGIKIFKLQLVHLPRVQKVEDAVSQVTYAILKNIVGSFILQELLEKRKEIAD